MVRLTMFPPWRRALREARYAYRSGRLEEAGELLARDNLRDFLPARQLASDVAARLLERADRRFAGGQSRAGWQDLAAAELLGGHEATVARMRQQYVSEAMDEVRRYLAAGDAELALDRLASLRGLGLADAHHRTFSQIATLIHEADRDARRGDAREMEKLARAARLAHEDGTMDIRDRLDRRHADAQGRLEQLQTRSEELHAALASEAWSDVLKLADAILAIAPEHTAASQARQRAWSAVGMKTTQAYGVRCKPRDVPLEFFRAGRGGPRSTAAGARQSEEDTVTGQPQPERALLWVDGVGGFLLCLDDTIVLGQPADRPIAVPILADLSRRHAVIRRDAGSYILEPIQQTQVDGKPLTGPLVLSDGELIQLGDSVQMRFRRPHALSSTARLTIESHHRTQPSVDDILLMADSCVLGPHKHCHVSCRDWQHDVVLYRQGEGWKCRSSGPLTVDGEGVSGPVAFGPGMRVEGDDFSMSLESV